MSSSVFDDPTTPEVSVVIACRNVEAFIDIAMRSVRRQTLADLEIIVADDGSTDGTLARLEAHAQEDGRVRILRLTGPSGAGGARNAAIAAARGRWISVLDGDDYFHPERLERLLALAGETGADIIADNQVLFDSAPQRNPRLLLPDGGPGRVDVAAMVQANVLRWKGGSLGYLKPVIRRDFLDRSNVRYDERLRIGEDYDFLLRLLAAGADLRVAPQPLYFYRKHPGSISYRMTADDLDQMRRADAAFRRDHPAADAQTLAALDRRAVSIDNVDGFLAAIEALKARRLGEAIPTMLRRPAVAALVLRAMGEGIARRVRRRARPAAPEAGAEPRVTLVTRQRINAANNGSSAYLLSLANTLRAAGFELDLISPSPISMGRWPVLKLAPEMRVFERIRVRGCLRIGDLIVRASPGPFLAILPAAVERLAARFNVAIPVRSRKAPYSVTAPWETADHLYLGREARPSRLLVADYCYQAPALPYVLQPQVRSAVVMHDLFWRRRSAFASAGMADTTETQLTEPEEMKLLGQADVVLAIQADEAALVQERLPRTPVVLAPMPAVVERQPAPGEQPALLFIGSDTAANVHGANWFLDEVWPAVRARRRDAELWVVGSVRNSLDPTPRPGVSLLGVAPDLTALYRRAAVAISPLTLGSGLKVKLIEALGMGKAVVATSVTVAGVEALMDDAVLIADDPAEFAEACVALLEDPMLRRKLGENALDVARRHFSPQACHKAFVQTALRLAAEGDI
jgi:glycosyltransferase involved in cell wall biosynthesis